MQSEGKVEEDNRGMKCINMKKLKEKEIHERYIMELAQCYGQRNRLADVHRGEVE